MNPLFRLWRIWVYPHFTFCVGPVPQAMLIGEPEARGRFIRRPDYRHIKGDKQMAVMGLVF